MFLGSITFFYGCGQASFKIQPLTHTFPTQMTFKGSVFKIQKAINEIFKSNSNNIFQTPSGYPLSITLYWKGSHHPEEITIFNNPINENDVYVSCNEMPLCKSQVYMDWLGRPLEFLADFQLHIIPQGAKETLVKVISINPQIMVGKIYTDVQPTSVEENEILQAIQNKLNS